IRALPGPIWQGWRGQPVKEKLAFLGVMAVLCVAMAPLLAPYLEVGQLYHFRRGWGEISSMLPRPASYLYSSNSMIWPSSGPLFDELPMEWEHALFVGLGPILFIVAAVALRFAGRTALGARFAPALVACLLLAGLTLYVGRYSPYLVVGILPGANAI